MNEIFQIKNELAPPVMDSMIERGNEPYNLRNFQEFLREKKELCIMVFTVIYIARIYNVLF